MGGDVVATASASAACWPVLLGESRQRGCAAGGVAGSVPDRVTVASPDGSVLGQQDGSGKRRMRHDQPVERVARPAQVHGGRCHRREVTFCLGESQLAPEIRKKRRRRFPKCGLPREGIAPRAPPWAKCATPPGLAGVGRRARNGVNRQRTATPRRGCRGGSRSPFARPVKVYQFFWIALDEVGAGHQAI